MCVPKKPKAPEPSKPKPLRVLLGRDKYDGQSSTGFNPGYFLPPSSFTPPGFNGSDGGPVSSGLNIAK